MKKFLWILSIISMLVLVNCGGGNNSSKDTNQTQQTTKELLAGKTFYAYDENGDDGKHILEIKINTDATSLTYKTIVGEGDSGDLTIKVDGDKFIVYYDDNTTEVNTVVKRDKYLAINPGEEGSMRFFYNLDDAQAFYNTSTTPNNESEGFKFTKEYLKGKTLYYVVYDDFGYDNINYKWNMVRWTFDDNTLAHTEYDTPDTDTHTLNYSITSDAYLNIEDIFSLKAISKNDDYIVLKKGYLFFDETKALEFRDKKRDENQKGFTKEMIQNKVVYIFNSIDEDGFKVYVKITYDAESSFTRRKLTVTEEGKIRNDETSSGNYIIEDGKMKLEDDDIYVYWVLNSQDNTAWYITEELDIGKDGTIDESTSYTAYLSKPSDYPDEL